MESEHICASCYNRGDEADISGHIGRALKKFELYKMAWTIIQAITTVGTGQPGLFLLTTFTSREDRIYRVYF